MPKVQMFAEDLAQSAVQALSFGEMALKLWTVI